MQFAEFESIELYIGDHDVVAALEKCHDRACLSPAVV